MIIDVTGERRQEGVSKAAAALREGQLAVLPTDTLYGVAADAFNPSGTGRIFAAKGRGRSVPLPVLVRSPRQLAGLTTTLPEAAEALVAAYWPGPLTVVIPAEPNLRWDLGDAAGTVAVRMPHDEVALAVIRAVGPLAVTSANRHGVPPGPTCQDAHEQLGDQVAVYLDDGPREGGVPSTVVDLTRREPHVLREGALPTDRVLAVARGELDPLDAAAADEERPEPSADRDGPGDER